VQPLLVALVAGMAAGPAAAAPSRCVLSGKQTHMEVTVSPPGVPTVQVGIEGGPAEVTLGPGTQSRVRVRSPLEFDGRIGPDGMRAFATRTVTTAGGMLRIGRGVTLEHLRRTPGGRLSVELPDQGVFGIPVACGDVSLDPAGEARTVPRQRATDGTLWKTRGDRLRFHASWGGGGTGSTWGRASCGEGPFFTARPATGCGRRRRASCR
jgi:hypothetical protein